MEQFTPMYFRKQLTKVYDNYKRSGQQDAENKYDEWAKFCNSSPSPVLYSICILDETKLSTYLGKEMSEGAAMDTGELTKKRALSSKESAKKRREQRLRAKKKVMSTNDDAQFQHLISEPRYIPLRTSRHCRIQVVTEIIYRLHARLRFMCTSRRHKY